MPLVQKWVGRIRGVLSLNETVGEAPHANSRRLKSEHVGLKEPIVCGLCCPESTLGSFLTTTSFWLQLLTSEQRQASVP